MQDQLTRGQPGSLHHIKLYLRSFVLKRVSSLAASFYHGFVASSLHFRGSSGDAHLQVSRPPSAVGPLTAIL